MPHSKTSLDGFQGLKGIGFGNQSSVVLILRTREAHCQLRLLNRATTVFEYDDANSVPTATASGLLGGKTFCGPRKMYFYTT